MNAKLFAVATVAVLGPFSMFAASGSIWDTGSITVHIDFFESNNAENKSSLDVSLSGTKSCAEVERNKMHADLTVRVCREGGSATSPVLAFNVRSTQRAEGQNHDRTFKMVSRVSAHTPTLIGKLVERDGTEAAIYANLGPQSPIKI